MPCCLNEGPWLLETSCFLFQVYALSFYEKGSSRKIWVFHNQQQPEGRARVRNVAPSSPQLLMFILTATSGDAVDDKLKSSLLLIGHARFGGGVLISVESSIRNHKSHYFWCCKKTTKRCSYIAIATLNSFDSVCDRNILNSVCSTYLLPQLWVQ